jgi:predicted DNA-binding transcriptional regulator AlpA
MENCNSRSNRKFMNVQEAAEFLRLAPKTLYGLVSLRRVPYRKAGRRLIFLQAELLKWTEPKTKGNRNL